MTRRRILIDALATSALVFCATALVVGCDGGSTESGTPVKRSPEDLAKEDQIRKATEDAFKQQNKSAKKK
ncbi:MAG: hypothetical protein P4L84_12815 [Isosphaeraceae bacterium]|nr:hypothetical protein [Isosphaeraceae bacterium]